MIQNEVPCNHSEGEEERVASPPNLLYLPILNLSFLNSSWHERCNRFASAAKKLVLGRLEIELLS